MVITTSRMVVGVLGDMASMCEQAVPCMMAIGQKASVTAEV